MLGDYKHSKKLCNRAHGSKKRNAPGATARGRREPDSLRSRVRHHSVSALEHHTLPSRHAA
jgi:hypothetical protein